MINTGVYPGLALPAPDGRGRVLGESQAQADKDDKP